MPRRGSPNVNGKKGGYKTETAQRKINYVRGGMV